MKPDDVRKSILGTEIAYIPQAAMNALNPTRKIINFIEDVILAHDPTENKKLIYDLARASFETLGLPAEVLQKYPVELSGGMKQRTVIAVSVILRPKVLIADEPSSALDVTSQKMVIKMLRGLMETGFIKSMIFITHELPLLYNVTDDIMVMYAGQIVEKATAKEAVFDPLHPYSKGLMGSIIVPESGLRDVKLTAIPGVPPNLKNPPDGLPVRRTLQIRPTGVQGDFCLALRCGRWPRLPLHPVGEDAEGGLSSMPSENNLVPERDRTDQGVRVRPHAEPSPSTTWISISTRAKSSRSWASRAAARPPWRRCCWA